MSLRQREGREGALPSLLGALLLVAWTSAGWGGGAAHARYEPCVESAPSPWRACRWLQLATFRNGNFEAVSRQRHVLGETF